jgi:hypothetical protein
MAQNLLSELITERVSEEQSSLCSRCYLVDVLGGMKRVAVTIVIGCLVLSLNLSTATAAVKPGTTCKKKLGQISTSAGIKYTCIKSGKKLVWNKGVGIKSTSPSTPAKFI